MESESIVDYLKSSLGKPWALLANSNGITITITKTGDETNLYPEWDEFYLLVCDICGIIIRPQALGKHLATKHRINVQQASSNHNHVLPNNNNNNNNNNNTNNINNINNNNKETSTILTNNTASVTQQTTIKPSLVIPAPCPKVTAPAPIPKLKSISTPTPVRLATPTTPSVASTNGVTTNTPSPQIPSLTPASKYQNRKWRNTYKVLRDAFL